MDMYVIVFVWIYIILISCYENVKKIKYGFDCEFMFTICRCNNNQALVPIYMGYEQNI